MAIKIDHKGYALERILNCCGLFEGKSPHPNPLPEGEGTLFGSPDQNGIRSRSGIGSTHNTGILTLFRKTHAISHAVLPKAQRVT